MKIKLNNNPSTEFEIKTLKFTFLDLKVIDRAIISKNKQKSGPLF